MKRSRFRAIGLMSGTSLDGIDAAMIETDGESVHATGDAITVPYLPELRDRLRSILGGNQPDLIQAIERDMTIAHADAVERLLARAGLRAGEINLVGFHGQTILHEPHAKRTWQIGDGALLASLLRVPVVCDFRSADVAAGGQGAPLLPLYHRALARDLPKPVAVLNLGGVGNITWIGEDDELIAFDTGPGVALLDDWILKQTGQPFDRDGVLSGSGSVMSTIVDGFLAHDYFHRKPPKTLDRDTFGVLFDGDLSPADGATTLAACTAAAVAAARVHLPSPPLRWLVTGGGRHNRALLDHLGRRLDAPVETVEAVGWDGDALEAQGFAYLAVRSTLGLPLSVPGTTGVPAPLTGGTLFHPQRSIFNAD
jgi:anhydro-N-acetylmuramic acid kinase